MFREHTDDYQISLPHGVNIDTWYMYICTYKVSSPVYRITLFLRTISRNMCRGALQAMWSVWFNVNYKEWLSFPQLWWQSRIRQSTLDKYMINFAIRITKAAMCRGHNIFRVPVALTLHCFELCSTCLKEGPQPTLRTSTLTHCVDFYYIQPLLNRLLYNKMSTTNVSELWYLFLTSPVCI